MRKLTMLFALASMVVACSGAPKEDYALVNGSISNQADNKLVITGNEFNHTIMINRDGTFSDTLKIAASGYYTLIYGRENTQLFINNGDNLSISLDARNFASSISFDGEGAQANNYLASKLDANRKATADAYSFYGLEEQAYISTLDALKKQHLAALESVSSDSDFTDLEKKNLSYDYFMRLNAYERMHGYYAKKQGFKVSEGFIPEELKNMTFDNQEDYQKFNSYKSLAMDRYMGVIVESLGEDYQSAAPDDFKVLEDVKIPALKNEIIGQIGSVLVSPGNPNMIALYEFFMANSTDVDFKQKLTVKYDQNKSLVRGMPSPQFTDYENHKGGTMSLTDLKGKYVYIDVWATWCGPCKREIPFLKEIETKYHGKNIEFVSASIDRMQDHEAWVQMVKDEQLLGHQLFADSDWQSAFVKGYAIEGIPRFILVDPEGNIVSADAPRPSNPKLIDLFNELKI